MVQRKRANRNSNMDYFKSKVSVIDHEHLYIKKFKTEYCLSLCPK